MTTGFIGEVYPDGYTPTHAEGEELGQMRALAVLVVADRMMRMASIGGADAETSFMIYDGASEGVAARPFDEEIIVNLDGKDYAFDDLARSRPHVSLMAQSQRMSSMVIKSAACCIINSAVWLKL